MTIDKQLFEGQLVRLAPIDHEADPPVESAWTHDPAYLHALGRGPAKPLSPAQLKKRYEAIEKEVEESKNLFYFTIRDRQDNRLLGNLRLDWIEWSHGSARLSLVVAGESDRQRGCDSDALQLILNYAFAELNLYRLSVLVAEDDQQQSGLYQEVGFVEEVRRRAAITRHGRTFDLIHYGLLHAEWQAAARTEESAE